MSFPALGQRSEFPVISRKHLLGAHLKRLWLTCHPISLHGMSLRKPFLGFFFSICEMNMLISIFSISESCY